MAAVRRRTRRVMVPQKRLQGVFLIRTKMPDAPASQECLLDEADMESESSCNDEDVDGEPVAEGDEVNPDKELRKAAEEEEEESQARNSSLDAAGACMVRFTCTCWCI